MRWLFAICLTILFPTTANAGQGLVMGLSTEELLSCSGQFFVETKQLNSRTFYKFAMDSDGSAALSPANVKFLGQKGGCEAMVEVENGKVVAAEIERMGRFVLSCAACYHLFSECKFIRR